MGNEIEEDESHPDYWKLLAGNRELQLQQLGFKYQDVLERLQAVEPVYRKLYKNPFYWIIRPEDKEITGRDLMYCSTCHRHFWGHGKEEKSGRHNGHRFGRSREASPWVFFKMRTGMLK
tara:strand:- start:80 stop:436 length:357 start_codon:yes stop_codon:yes gene_type:complete